MAEAAKKNQIDASTVNDFLDRFIECDDKAASIMATAMKACKDGPRKEQKEMREEMKQSGMRKETFNALLAARRAEAKASKKIVELEGDDHDQLVEIALELQGTPFGDFVKARLDEI